MALPSRRRQHASLGRYPTVVRLAAARKQPASKANAIACIGIAPPPLLHYVNKNIRGNGYASIRVYATATCYLSALYQGISYGNRHHRIVREKTTLAEQREVLCFDVVPFIDRAYDITDYCPKYYFRPPRFMKSASINSLQASSRPAPCGASRNMATV